MTNSPLAPEETFGCYSDDPYPDSDPLPTPAGPKAKPDATVESGRLWGEQETITFKFHRHGDLWVWEEIEKQIVRLGFQIWKDQGIGLTFREVGEADKADIPIGRFEGNDGRYPARSTWSRTGTRCKTPYAYGRSMNFGQQLWSEQAALPQVLHEIGHALGLNHEHQNGKSGIVWNEASAIAYYGRLYGCDPANAACQNQVRSQVLKTNPVSKWDTVWDPLSIMHYAVPAHVIAAPAPYNQTGITSTRILSEGDRRTIRMLYPVSGKRALIM